MGCSTSKIAIQGRRIFNKHGQRFRFRTLGRSSHHRIIEDISMHTTKCLDGSTTTTMDCNSITTSIDIENNDDDDDGDECCFPIMDHHPSELSSFSFMAKSNVVYNNNNNNNNVICDESNEKVVLPSLKEEEVVEECELRNDQTKIDNGDDYDYDHVEKEEVLVEANRVSHCLSFKVYVRALDGESNKETKLGGMMKNKDFTDEDATACMKQLSQFPKEQSTITLQSIQRVMSNSVKKVRRGKSFSRIIPKPTPINSILGVSIRCHSSKNRTSISSIW